MIDQKCNETVHSWVVVGMAAVPTANVAAVPAMNSSAPSSSYEQVIRDEWPRLVRLADAIVGNRQAAEDLVQDSCIRLLGAGDRVENPGAYLRTIVVNRCKTFTVRRTREQSVRSVASPVVDPPELDETFTALRHLPPKQRTVLALRYYEDLSVDAIAQLTGMRSGTVKSLLHRSLKQLRTELERIPT